MNRYKLWLWLHWNYFKMRLSRISNDELLTAFLMTLLTTIMLMVGLMIY